MKRNFLLITSILISTITFAQYNYRDSNRIGIAVGINQFSLNTSDFDTKPGIGWNAGFSVRGNFYNDFDMVYAMQFSENNFMVETINPLLQKEDVNYKLPSAQIALQLSYKVVENHLSIEFGPVVQINGKLNIEGTEKNNIIRGTLLRAGDIVDISKFNFYPAAGVTFGVKHVRANIQYLYGVNNMLSNLESNLKGYAGILNGNLIVYL
jgi:hypothetical protein